MQGASVPSAFDSLCNATHEALMWALSRPGLPRGLPQAGHPAILDTLIDRVGGPCVP
jgi:alpha-D-ribose 1-methylphosphonate 5-triphosphate synthase subunit PhnH